MHRLMLDIRNFDNKEQMAKKGQVSGMTHLSAGEEVNVGEYCVKSDNKISSLCHRGHGQSHGD